MKIAVTGATGFIGQHVASELENRSIPITLVLRDVSHLPISLAHHNIAIIDIKDPPVNSYELMGYPDILIHLAWSGLPNYKSLHHFEEELQNNFNF